MPKEDLDQTEGAAQKYVGPLKVGGQACQRNAPKTPLECSSCVSSDQCHVHDPEPTNDLHDFARFSLWGDQLALCLKRKYGNWWVCISFPLAE